jgi:hypothetical protein
MKKHILFIAVTAVIGLAMTGCGKEPLQSDKLSYVGIWTPKEENPDHTIEVMIKEDGTGSYAESKPGFSKTASGNVYFKSARVFTIGGRILKLKVHVDRFPYRVVESEKPYKYHYEATFNGVEVKRGPL